MFAQAKLYLYGAVLLAFVGLAGTLYVYKLKFEKAEILQQQAEQQRDTMMEVNKQILKAQEEDAKLRKKLFNDFKEARNDVEKYRKKIAEHDLSSLANNKPGLITLYARRATERVLRDIETAANGTAETMPGATTGGHPGDETPPSDSGGD